MNLIPFFVIIPLATAFFIPLVGKRIKRIGDIVSIAATISLLGISISIASLIITNKVLIFEIGKWAAPMGISMVVDGFSAFMLVIVNTISFLVALYCAGYIKKYTDT